MNNITSLNYILHKCLLVYICCMNNKASTWIEINKNAVSQNIKLIKTILKANVMLTTVVKANGYGHGAIEISRIALENGADRLAVAHVEEGIELRKAKINAPILILSAIPFGAIPDAIENTLILTVASLEFAKEISRVAKRKNKTAMVHIKIDSGMRRYGIPENESAKLVREITSLPNLNVEGIFTHFASADENDLSFTHEQAAKFESIINNLKKDGIKILLIHASNSAATLQLPQYHYDMVRVGLVIYGVSPISKLPKDISLQPALSLKSRVGLLKQVNMGDTIGYGRTFKAHGKLKSALVLCGYADGLPRFVSNKGFVLINGQRCKILGRVSMDQTIVDITNVESVKIGDEVVLIGKQKQETITVEEFAKWAETIPYEIFTSINQLASRVPKVYY